MKYTLKPENLLLYYRLVCSAFGEEYGISQEAGWPQRALYLTDQLKFGVKIYDCPPSQVGERVDLEKHPLD